MYHFEKRYNFKIVEERILKRSHEENRSDDKKNIITNRLDKYMLETFPVSKVFYNKFKNIYYEIEASKDISQIQKDLTNILKKGQK